MTKRMMRILALIVMSFWLTGCAVYQSIGKSIGAFVHPVTGNNFVHIDNNQWDSSRNAVIYFYRPHSKWASQEIESPSVYVDDTHYFNIRDNGYTWLEVYPGRRHIIIRRPLLGLEGMGNFDLSRIADGVLDAQPGKVYYLRYSEVAPPEAPNPDLDAESPLASGTLQLVSRELAIKEIVDTRFLKSDPLAPNHAGTSIVEVNRKNDYKADKDRLAKERVEEIEVLKAKGQYSEAPWYWPFGGGSRQSLDADRKLLQVEKDYQDWLDEKERKAEAEAAAAEAAAGKPWWKLF